MRLTFLTLTFLVLLQGTAFAQSSAEILVRCAPSETREWPYNAYVEVSKSESAVTMKVTSSFYGSIFENSEMVEAITTPTQVIFQGTEMKLTINLKKPNPKANAILETKEDGAQSLSCR